MTYKTAMKITIAMIVMTVIATVNVISLWVMDYNAISRECNVTIGEIQVIRDAVPTKVKRLYQIWEVQDKWRLKNEIAYDLLNGFPSEEEWARRNNAELAREEHRGRIIQRIMKEIGR